MAQGMSPPDAACAGVFLHGLAADIAVQSLTEYCLAAGDLPDFLPQAFAAVLKDGAGEQVSGIGVRTLPPDPRPRTPIRQS
jgi:hypothetical protein